MDLPYLDLRCHVVTADTTYKGHIFTLDEHAGVARLWNRERDLVIREMIVTEANTRDGQVWRVVGAVDGAEQIWRIVKACARCATVAVYPTPAYDIPT